MGTMLLILIASYALTSAVFSFVASSVVLLLADMHRVYIKQRSSNNPCLLLILFVPILNVLLALISAYIINTDAFMLRMELLSESMTPDEAAMFDANPTFTTAISITKAHNQA